MKILPLIPSEIFPFHYRLLRGMLPTSNAQLMSRKPSSRSAVGTTDCSSGKAQSCNSHNHAIKRAERIRNFNQMQRERLIPSEHFPGGDAKDKRVTNLSGCAGDSDLKRRLHFRLSTLNAQVSTLLKPHHLNSPALYSFARSFLTKISWRNSQNSVFTILDAANLCR